MTTAYFDCFAGASGDMILGSLLDAGVDIEFLKKELKKLNIDGYEITAEKSDKKGISGTRFHVKVTEKHHHRGLKDIFKIIDQSSLSPAIIDKSKSIFKRLAEAEAKIHNKSVDEIHFHEVGAVDAIVDVVGAVIALDNLKVARVCASRIHVGTGTLECAHGTLPVPPPATLELLKGIPVHSTGINKELVTPTGAAILSTLAESFDSLPALTIDKSGYGLGYRDLEIPNLIRVVIGEESDKVGQDTIQCIETNIDDMNPQFYEHIMETLFAHGAKDVFLTPVIMKKNRPGVILNVLADPLKTDEMIRIIFQETTTLGVRISELKKRRVLHREIEKVKTPWGNIRVKKRIFEDQITVAPEYDDCKRIAQEHHIPIHEVYKTILKLVDK